MTTTAGHSQKLDHALAPKAARRVAKAATAFLASLTPEQHAQAIQPFEGAERYEWAYTPIHRNGLTLREMTGGQVDLALALMDSVLSTTGATTAREVMKLEATLNEWETVSRFVTPWNRTVERYYFTVHGTPGASAPWGIRVGGHHIGIHLTVLGNELVSVMPHFFGANPAEVRHGPDRGKRVLAAEEDVARQLLAALDGDRKKKAVTSKEAPRDILTHNSRTAKPDIAPRGITFSALTDDQRTKLVALIKVYTGRVSDDLSTPLWNRYQAAGLDTVTFAWEGAEERGQGHYYAVQGPQFLIEYDNTQNGANHIHAVLRDFTHDWGEDILATHYKDSHR